MTKTYEIKTGYSVFSCTRTLKDGFVTTIIRFPDGKPSISKVETLSGFLHKKEEEIKDYCNENNYAFSLFKDVIDKFHHSGIEQEYRAYSRLFRYSTEIALKNLWVSEFFETV